MNIAQNWIKELEKSENKFPEKPKRFSRVWRRIFKKIPNVKGKVLDVGCGIGVHLAQFQLNGWKISGIDCSSKILSDARQYLGSEADLMLGDFMVYDFSNSYDLVFHVGVVEHYLDNLGRLEFIKKMFSLVKKDGHLISIVPINAPKELNPPDLQQINYTSKIMRKEFGELNGEIVKIFPHNLKGIFAPIPFPIEKFSGTLIGIIKK